MKKPTQGAAKAKGIAEQVSHKLKGHHGILNTLAKEHGEVDALMMRVAATRDSDDGVSTRKQLFEKIAVELLSHSNAEERELYSVLERYPESQARAKTSNSEHRDIERLITEIDSLPYSSDDWMRTFTQLQDAVKHHVKVEESELFDLAKELLSKDELKAMDQRFLAEKKRQRESLEGRPTTPGQAPGDSPHASP